MRSILNERIIAGDVSPHMLDDMTAALRYTDPSITRKDIEAALGGCSASVQRLRAAADSPCLTALVNAIGTRSAMSVAT